MLDLDINKEKINVACVGQHINKEKIDVVLDGDIDRVRNEVVWEEDDEA